MASGFPTDTFKYKLLISDYDGTLVGKDRVISPQIRNAIKKWKDSGRKFCLATGRQYLMLKDECKIFDLTDPIVVRGGSEIADPVTGKIIYTVKMEHKVLVQLMDLVHVNGMHICFEIDDKFYSDYYFRAEFESILTFNKLQDLPEIDFPKAIIFSGSEDVDTKAQFVDDILINKFPQLHVVEVHTREGRAWDVTSLKANKHLTVLELMKILGIDRHETVGVGDGYNDFPLLEACGLKVAMGNANEDLKAVADIIIPSHDQNGVAFLIDKLLQ